MKYEVVVLFFDDEGNECGSLVSERSYSPHIAAKDVLHRYANIRNEAGLLKEASRSRRRLEVGGQEIRRMTKP